MNFGKGLILGLFIILGTLTAFFSFYFYNEKTRQFMTVAFLDVGQGDAIFIETPNGNQVLIDTGPDSKVVREIGKILPFYDRKIDAIITTHSDADHVGGLPEILKRFEIENFIYNGVEDDDSLNTKINNLINDNEINQIVLGAGDKIILDKEKDIFIEILWPVSGEDYKDNNEYSIITKINYGKVAIILTGDASVFAENELLNAKNINLKSNILKAGHHGSKTSSSAEFLKAANPDFVVISAGKDNKFGHPHPEVLENIKNETNAKILETFASSTIVFQSDGDLIWIK